MRPGKLLPLFLAFFLLSAISCEAKTGILLAAFGSSQPTAKKAYESVGEAFARAFPESPVVWAFTSQKLRAKARAEGVHLNGVAEGLDKLAAEGATSVVIQSLHMTAGAEFAGLERSALLYVARNPDKFKAVYLGRPLLESDSDARKTAQAALADLREQRSPGEAVVFMAHGNSAGRSDLALRGAAALLGEADGLAFLASVEGSPSIDELIDKLKALKVRKVWLSPLMIVAGDHAANDMAGADEDSWASKLRAAGFEVQANLKGLGELPGIAELLIEHSAERADDLTREPVKQ